MHQRLFAALLVGLFSMTGCSADEGSDAPTATRLPSTFAPSDVRIVVIRQSNMTSFPTQRVVLETTGGTSLEQNGEVRSFECPVAELVAELSELYRLRFFDLPSNLNVSHAARLGDDGLIRPSILRMSDQATTTIEVSVQGYSHTVIFTEKDPPELAALATQMFALAQSHL